jgi:hypothetical protein
MSHENVKIQYNWSEFELLAMLPYLKFIQFSLLYSEQLFVCVKSLFGC